MRHDRFPNTVKHTKVLCLHKRTGKVVWERTAYEGVPKEKRHIKATFANSTPATDGRIVVAFFGSQGLYAFDPDGKLLWKKDLGRQDAGGYDAPDLEFGTASSPILYQDLVIVQCDHHRRGRRPRILLPADEPGRWNCRPECPFPRR